jgi:hypothetical protein
MLLFHVDFVKVVDQLEEIVNAFTVVRKTESMHTLDLPPSQKTLNMIDDDILLNNVLRRLERMYTLVLVISTYKHHIHHI